MRYAALGIRSRLPILALTLGLAGCQAGAPKLPAWFANNRTQPTADQKKLASGSSISDTPRAESLTKSQRADVQIVMAQSLERQGAWEKAADAYRRVLQNDPTRADALHRLAIVHDKQGRHAEALPLYQQALAHNPGSAELHGDLGYCLYLQRRWAEAERELRTAISMKPNLPRVHNNLGLLLARAERSDEALKEFTLAGCREPEARLNLAHALLLERRWNEAQAQCELAVHLPDANPSVRTRAREMQAMLAQSTKAIPAPIAAAPAYVAPQATPAAYSAPSPAPVAVPAAPVVAAAPPAPAAKPAPAVDDVTPAAHYSELPR